MTSDSTYVLHLGRFETSRALLPKWAHENMEKFQNTHLAPNASLWDRHTSFPPRRLGLQLIVGSMEKVLRNMRSIGGCIALSQTRQMGTLYSTWHIPHHAQKGSSPHVMSCPRESKEKWNFCRQSSIGRYTGVQHCSAGPALRRQKIPQNRPNFRVFDIFEQTLGRRTPPLFWGRRNQKNRSFPAKKPLFVDILNFGKKQLLKS